MQEEIIVAQPAVPRKKNDELLKSAFKDNFQDFLRFVYPDADEVLDFSKEIEFMDKELFAIIPDRERRKDKRVADLLAKLHLKDGTEKWVLLNVEIEGNNDPEFAFRLLQYNYRIRDRYKVSVATIAIFTGPKNQLKQTVYRDELLGTVLSFKYRSYHVFDDNKEKLLANRNPFALIALACQYAILEGKIPEDELGEKRLTIAKALLAHGYDRDRIISFLGFLKNFIFIENEEINSKFDQLTYDKEESTMGSYVLETLKKQQQEEARREAVAEKNHSFVENLIKQFGFSDEQAAKAAEVSISFVKKVRKEIEAKKIN